MIREIMLKEKKSYTHIKYMIDNLLDNINIKGKNILDIGCGTGIRTAGIVYFGEPKTCVGIDINKRGIKEGRGFLAKVHNKKIRLYEKNIEEFKGKNQFDVIIMINSLHHFSNSLYLKNIFYLLKPNGIIIIQEQNKYSAFLRKNVLSKDKYTPHTLVPLIRKAGFEIIKYKYYVPYKLRKLKFFFSNILMNIFIGKAYFIYGKKRDNLYK